MTTSYVKGYKYILPSKGHKIRAKVSGLSVDISFTSGSKVTGNGSDVTYSSSSGSWAYQIDADCNSLVGYKEYHTGQYNIKKSSTNKIVDTITVSKTVSLY